MTDTVAYILYGLFALGGAAVFLAMPRPSGGHAKSGAIVGLCTLIGLIALLATRFVVPHSTNVYFYLFSAVAIFAAGRVITHPKPVYSAVYFGVVVLCVAVLLVVRQAEFLAVALVIIYAGAILVTYAFVIMLAQQSGASVADVRAREPMLAIVVTFVAMGALSGQVNRLVEVASPWQESAAAPTSREPVSDTAVVSDIAVSRMKNAMSPGGNTLEVGQSMFGDYIVVVELAGVLLLVAMVGAIAIAKKSVPVLQVGPPPPAPGTIGRQAPPF